MVKKAMALVAVLAVAGIGAAGCTRSQPNATPTAASSLPAEATSAAAPPSPSASPILEDGRHPVYLTKLDIPGSTVTFDLIQFLTGAEAKKAWVKDHPEYPDGPDNDYYIINDNPKLRTLPISGSVKVKIMDTAAMAEKTITLDKLPAHLSTWTDSDGTHRLWPTPFWLTVKGGQVTMMEEQFLP